MDNITGNEPINPIKEQPFIYEFPDGTRRIDLGLTIRQHFAAMAMQGMSSACQGFDSKGLEHLAKCAVLAADALIAELNKSL